MTRRRIAGFALGAIVLVIAAAAAWMLGPALLPPKNIDAGIAVGGKAPVDMELMDGAGLPTTLSAKMGKRGMVLFLVRSADWCPFCQAQLIDTKDIQAEVNRRGYALVSLSYDKPSVLAEFAVENGIIYPLLSDPGSKVIDALGLRDPQYHAGSFAYGVPRASILILSPNGAVTAKYVAQDYRSRPSNSDILAMLGAAS